MEFAWGSPENSADVDIGDDDADDGYGTQLALEDGSVNGDESEVTTTELEYQVHDAEPLG